MSQPKCDCHEKYPTWPVFRANYHVDGCPYREIEVLLAERDQLRARVATLEAELKLWRPLTPEEAEKALDEAEAVPMTEQQIAEIVKRATDPAARITNSEQAQLSARVAELEAALRPFAEFAADHDKWHGNYADSASLAYPAYGGGEHPIRLAHVRRAAELLKRPE